jgi:uncharacterized protein with NAD-binding domain and iron-sulfur cluster
VAAVSVAVIGGGMAGLTAAYRLAERNYRVTLYEQKTYLGGQFGAHSHARRASYLKGQPRPSVKHEHCYHMFLNWYHNFWRLAADLGLQRERDFEPRHTIKHLHRGEFPRMRTFGNPATPASLLTNLFSGVEPPPDVFLHGYSLIDLLAQRFRPDSLLDRYTVAGFMSSRPYASERSTALHEQTLAKAFANPSYLTSASSYQSFIKYGLRDPEPLLWALKGDSQTRFHGPFEQRLGRLNVECFKGQRVTRLLYNRSTGRFRVESQETRQDLPHEASLAHAEGLLYPTPRLSGGRARRTVDGPFDYVILAVPPLALPALVGSELAPVRKFETNPMASLDLYFSKKVPGIPREHVVLHDSEYGLTFIDNSQLWPGLRNTVLNVIATDFEELADLPSHDVIKRIMREMARYIPPEHLGHDDIEYWHIQPNLRDELFLNQVGSEQWRPQARTEIPSLFLAGDYCQTFVDVVTIEGAVVSGLEAARALQEQARADARRRPQGDRAHWRPIDIIRPPAYPRAALAALKLALTPLTPWAKAWSWLEESRRTPAALNPAELAGSLTRVAEWVVTAPYAFVGDVFNVGATLWDGLLAGRDGRAGRSGR